MRIRLTNPAVRRTLLEIDPTWGHDDSVTFTHGGVTLVGDVVERARALYHDDLRTRSADLAGKLLTMGLAQAIERSGGYTVLTLLNDPTFRRDVLDAIASWSSPSDPRDHDPVVLVWEPFAFEDQSSAVGLGDLRPFLVSPVRRDVPFRYFLLPRSVAENVVRRQLDREDGARQRVSVEDAVPIASPTTAALEAFLTLWEPGIPGKGTEMSFGPGVVPLANALAA